MRALLVAAGVVVVGAACSPNVPMPVCNPGDTRTCAGPGACMGGQECLPDGTGFASCNCGTPMGGGGGTTGGGTAMGGGSANGGGGTVGGGAATGGGAAVGGGAATGGGTAVGGGSANGGGGGVGGGAATGGGGTAMGGGSAVGGGGATGGGFVDGGDDAGTIDGGADAGFDAGIDAGPTISAELYFLETKVLNPGTSATFYGQGLEATFAFRSSHEVPPPVLEEQPGSRLGCKAWVLTPAQELAWRAGIDEGAIQVTATAGTSPPVLPACTFAASSNGYWCPDLSTQSTGGVIAAGPMPGLFTLTDADVTFNAANSIGRHVRITGATNAANNGLHPIFAVAGANTIVPANPAFVAETLPIVALHVNVAGAGVIPTIPDPGYLNDDVVLSIALASGGLGDIASFTATTGAGTVGDMPTLSTASLNVLNAVPTDGAQFSVFCDSIGCPIGSAALTMLEIATTDAPVGGLSPFAMPAPTMTAVRVRCSLLAQSNLTVPAAYSAFLQSSGATRLQATFMRLALHGGAPASVVVGSGQAIRGYRTP